MKYSSKAVWNAIGVLIPNVEVARTEGITLNLPEMLKAAAVEVFIVSETTEFKLSYEKLVAADIVRTVLTGLNTYGVITFGECDSIFK